MKYLLASLALVLLPNPAFSDVWTFETPSENIQCVVAQDFNVLSEISCTIIDKSGQPAKPQPKSCQGGWGHTFSMREKGPVEMGCGYPSRDKSGFDKADYGVTGNFGGFTCHSSTKGLKCTNRDGNGFFLSRRHQYIVGAYRDSHGSTQAAVSEDQKSSHIGYYPVWGSEVGQGIVEAGVGDGNGSELRLVCNISGLDTIASKLRFGPQSAAPSFASAGSTVEFLFDGQHSVPILFNADDSFVVERDAASIGTFKFLVSGLKKYSYVVVKLPDGRQLRFPLRGSSKAIGSCPATPSSVPLQASVQDGGATPVPENRSSDRLAFEFSDFPPTSLLQSDAQFPDFNGRDQGYREYRTRIREGVSQGVNFAGHYSFVTIGCGTDCRFGFVVDLLNGKVFDFPYGGEEQYQMDLRFNRDSRLLKVRWKGEWDNEACTEKDMLVEGSEWRILDERTVPTDDGLCFFSKANKANPGDAAVSQTTINETGRNNQEGVSNELVAETGAGSTLDTEGYFQNDASAREAGQTNGQRINQEQSWETSEQHLETLGFDPGVIDGIVDAKTIEAVTAFQKTYGLQVLGYLPPEHFAILGALAATRSGSRSDSTNYSDKAEASNIAADAYSVRERVVANHEFLVGMIEGHVSTRSLQIFRNTDFFEQILAGSVPFVGCLNDPHQVYGFFSPTRNFWLFAEISATTGYIVDARVSAGLVPRGGTQETAWFDLVEDSKNIPEAIRRASLVQLRLFEEHFPDEACQTLSAMDGVFNQEAGLTQIAISESEKPRQSGPLSRKFARLLTSTYDLEDENVLVNTLLLRDVAGFKYLTAFTSKKNANLFLLQGWGEAPDGLHLEDHSHSVIFEIE